ncbi:MAG TPA: hypothetical protein PLX55_01010 [bacterium]|jgi:hypothetical protein|nr:hypothetical protein [bacterium]
MPEQVVSSHNKIQNKDLPVPQSSSTVPTHKVRIRTVYAGICYVLAVLLVSLLTYSKITEIQIVKKWSRVLIIDIIVLVVFACLVTTGYYLVRTRHTVASKRDLLRYLLKLLPFVALIVALIYSLRFFLPLFLLLFSDHLGLVDVGSLLMNFIAAIVPLVGLSLVFRKAHLVAKQIPVAPGVRLGGVILLLLILPILVTVVGYNSIKNFVVGVHNISCKNSKLWTFVPTSSTHPLSLMDRVAFPDDGIWYFDENNHVAYYDFRRKENTFISAASYNYKTYKGMLGEIYGDYFVFRSTMPSETADKKEEYIILNKKRTGGVRAAIPQPSRVYDRSGNRYTILPGDMYSLSWAPGYVKVRDKDTILIQKLVSINQRSDYYQYVEMDLISGKVTELDRQSFDNASTIINSLSDYPRTAHQYDIDHVANDTFYYVIDRKTGAKVKQPSRSAYCKISGGENYLICDTEDLEWWPDKSKKGFVYWSLSELME